MCTQRDWEEAITSSTHDCGLKKVVAVDQSTYTPDRSARISPVREEGLETLPFAELRRLALTLGLLAADIARAVDKPELLELITQHQRRAARHARVRTHENAERSNGAERRASSVSARVSSQLPHPGNRNRSSLSVGARDRRLDSTVATPAIRQANFVPRGSTHSAPSARLPRPPRRTAPGPEPRASARSAPRSATRSPPSQPERDEAPRMSQNPRRHAPRPQEPLRCAGQLMLGPVGMVGNNWTQQQRAGQRHHWGESAGSISPRPKRRAQ